MSFERYKSRQIVLKQTNRTTHGQNDMCNWVWMSNLCMKFNYKLFCLSTPQKISITLLLLQNSIFSSLAIDKLPSPYAEDIGVDVFKYLHTSVGEMRSFIHENSEWENRLRSLLLILLIGTSVCRHITEEDDVL